MYVDKQYIKWFQAVHVALYFTGLSNRGLYVAGLSMESFEGQGATCARQCAFTAVPEQFRHVVWALSQQNT